MDPKTKVWWSDYSMDPVYRLNDPVRREVQDGFRTIFWRTFSTRPTAGRNEEALWLRVWDLGVQGGATVPLHDAQRGLYGSFSAICFGDRREFEDWYACVSDMLVAYAYFFHHGLSERDSGTRLSASPLTRRERECLTFVAEGYCSKEIARHLGLSPRTVDLHIARSMKRLGARNRIEAVSIALKQCLIET